MEIKNNFAENLKTMRLSKNLTQTKLAEILGIHKQTISVYEKGNSLPDLYSIIKISNFFNCSIDELIYSNSNIKSNEFEPIDEFKIINKKIDNKLSIIENATKNIENSLNKRNKKIENIINNSNKDIHNIINNANKEIKFILSQSNLEISKTLLDTNKLLNKKIE